MDWQPIETAPKGEPKPYGAGPRILGLAVKEWGASHNIVYWSYYKDTTKGAWKGPYANWTPTHWMPLPEPPESP